MTDRQKQHLLGYLGYYSGIPDGIWGRLSEEAAVAFQREYGLEPDGVVGQATEQALRKAVAGLIEPVAGVQIDTDDPEDWWWKYPNFTRLEFGCRCGGKYCDGFPAEPQQKLVALLQKIRDHYGKPVIRESGLRCQRWNAIQHGVANSRHMTGQAMDFYIPGVNPEEIVSWVKANCPECAYTYAIRRPDGTLSGTVHVDVVI